MWQCNWPQQQNARLTGLYVIPHPYFAPHHRDPQELADEARRAVSAGDRAVRAGDRWICVDSLKTGLDLPNALNLHAHYHDLLVVSQTDYDAPDRTIPAKPAGKSRARFRPSGLDRPLRRVSSKPSASARCSPGAVVRNRLARCTMRCRCCRMPNLVRVISIQGRGGDEAYKVHDADICDHLQRYELPISSEKLNAGELSVGDLLLNRCADQGIDLLVMGAFSQSRRGHQTLGEVGTHLLEYMTVPVLMSY